MKKKLITVSLIILVLLGLKLTSRLTFESFINSFGNSKQHVTKDVEKNIGYEKIDRLKNITYAFDKFELFLKPQSSKLVDDSFNLNELKPDIYELLDDTLLIYCFKDEKSLNKGLEQIQEVFNNDYYKYTIEDDILIIYYPSEYSLEATNSNKKIQEVVEYIENSK
ncbi:MAG: hypothetical protein PEPC_01972 [Peptostreptococcus russellii]|uniref:hypothetical protein n=1 Tax=Tissierella TaxID=41273 RepID=UPI000BA0CE16|nr:MULTISPECIES: hypothetical protein [Tissierella]MBU5311426.1 hypothetical protein [Tissierella carlieri]MDU5080671.1 hypothetical protein [Bacillota bacterium]OZV10185.1 hypothetical protein CIW83_21705 [Tissierella sp. P1]